jgi:pimeloyl-ACP methyl ester carboxylesterase
MVDFTTDTDHPVRIPCDHVMLDGLLHIPQHAKGIVIFAHGSGSSRLSPRNQFIAHQLQQIQFATLLFDLLTSDEEQHDSFTSQYRFDIPFLAHRLVTATRWVIQISGLNKLPVGYFGASTGGAAALVAAAQLKNLIKSVVSRGGRPDLAGESLPSVQAPTLLIVGGDDHVVIQLNQQASRAMTCHNEMVIVPGATHLFEEPGKLDEVAELANAWFIKYA